MTDAKKEEQIDFSFQTPHVCSYSDVLEARRFKKNGVEQGDPKFGGTFVVAPDNPDYLKLKAEIVKLLQAHAPGMKVIANRRLTQEEADSGTAIEVNVPWKDGTKFADAEKAKGKNAEYARGNILLKASSKFQPALAAIENKNVLEFTTPEGIASSKKFFYSGAYLVPSFGLHWYKGDANKPNGVSLYLNAAMFVKHGPRLVIAQKSAAEAFKGYIGSISEEDPTAGAPVDELSDL
jgi:hypothetical protein